MKGIGYYNLVLILVILICLGFLIFQNSFRFSGKTVEIPVSSNVSISKYVSITFSSNLSEGILFGVVSVLPAENINASHNYDGESNSTSLYINVSADGNTAVDFCIRANDNLTSVAADAIGLANETYANSTVTNTGTPGAAANSTALTTSYVKSGNAVSTGGVNYYRFWLDIPAAQPSGNYNNTVFFKGVTTTLSCG